MDRAQDEHRLRGGVRGSSPCDRTGGDGLGEVIVSGQVPLPVRLGAKNYESTVWEYLTLEKKK
jgi:hypothetical protein